MIYREHYIKKIREFYDSDLIKIITGIRRCGKSIILEQIMSEIKQKTDNVIYLNFEDKRTISKISNSDDLINYVEANKKDGKCYLFFDEIQTLQNWHEACKTLRLYDYSIFITGSNSKLLSSEFAKELSGRYVAFRIRPFVYKEILEYAKELNRKMPVHPSKRSQKKFSSLLRPLPQESRPWKKRASFSVITQRSATRCSDIPYAPLSIWRSHRTEKASSIPSYRILPRSSNAVT